MAWDRLGVAPRRLTMPPGVVLVDVAAVLMCWSLMVAGGRRAAFDDEVVGTLIHTVPAR
jgi:hypothetical protein